MLFNSYDFLLFAVLVLGGHWLARGQWRNGVLLVGSLYFYGVVDPRLLALILGCAAAGYIAGLLLRRGGAERAALGLGVVVPLAILATFKYFDFFAVEIIRVLDVVGLGSGSVALNLVLPVGVSFYTFQTIGYVIDVRRGKVEAETDPLDFFLFVTFFPQLVAGPIERADHLLPQIKADRRVDGRDAMHGTFLIAQGLVKKVVIADTLAGVVNTTLALEDPSGPLILVMAVAFAGQIYGDFSGYTDIARGVARLFGFELLVNFRQPYRSTSPAEFWARWHITLSNWFRDYVYIPIGGNRSGAAKTIRNLMVTMTLSGLWHGASLNFVMWGAFHGAALVAHRLTARWWDRLPRPVTWVATMAVVVVGWVMFRVSDAEALVDALAALGSDFRFASLALTILATAAPYLALLLIVDAVEQRVTAQPADAVDSWALAPTLAAYVCLALVLGSEVGGDFIYFQF